MLEFLHASWEMLVISAPYILLGTFVTGLMRAFIPLNMVEKHLGGGSLWPVVKASVLGAPLPL